MDMPILHIPHTTDFVMQCCIARNASFKSKNALNRMMSGSRALTVTAGTLEQVSCKRVLLCFANHHLSPLSCLLITFEDPVLFQSPRLRQPTPPKTLILSSVKAEDSCFDLQLLFPDTKRYFVPPIV